MGKLQIAVVNVEGTDESIRDALKAGLTMIEHTNNGYPIALADEREVKTAAREISNATVARAVAKVRRGAENPAAKKTRAKYTGPRLPCRKGCGRTLKNPQARGKHENACTAPAKPAQDPNVYPFECGSCEQRFMSAIRRDNHERDKHPDAA